jgi:L-amino acid N-acyltransferase YncA
MCWAPPPAGPFACLPSLRHDLQAPRKGAWKASPPMTKPQLRPARIADVPAICSIYGPAVTTGTASFELEPPDEAEMLRRFKAITDARYPYFVAELDGQVLGYAYANAYRPRRAYRFTVEDSVYVAANAQGRGVGQLLLGGLIDACVQDGFRLMVAVIGDSAQHRSIALHRRMGFTFCGTIHSVGYKHGRWLDSVLMQLPLGLGDRTTPTERG